MRTDDALKAAVDQELDLVVIAPTSQPPVAKILDFKKFLYQENKEKAKSKVRSKKSETKEIMFKPYTAEGDLSWQIDRAKEWLQEGNRVKVWVAMKGRAIAHPEISVAKIKKFETDLENFAKIEAPAITKGNVISIVFLPK